MKYDFDRITDRKGTNSCKWDVRDGELPMWVADMDIASAPCVTEAIMKRAQNGIFGYSDIPDEWYDAYISWWKERHGVEFRREDMVFASGVIPTLSSCVRKLTTPAENVAVLTPVYNHFFTSIANNGRNILEVPLIYDRDALEYSIDFDALEKALSNPQTSMFMLCNPHNPIGIIWDKETLARIGELCRRYGVIVVSDEIHCDITKPGTSYVPFASASETCADISVSCVSISKAFNCAGIHSAAVFAKNPVLRHKVWRSLNTDEIGEPNSFACEAAVAALTEGGEWLDSLNEYLFENRRIVEETVNGISGLKAIHGDATYLIWIDVTGLGEDAETFCDFIRSQTGLFLSDGAQYGEGGKGFIRFNAACPRSLVMDGLNRLRLSAEKFKLK